MQPVERNSDCTIDGAHKPGLWAYGVKISVGPQIRLKVSYPGFPIPHPRLQ